MCGSAVAMVFETVRLFSLASVSEGALGVEWEGVKACRLVTVWVGPWDEERAHAWALPMDGEFPLLRQNDP